jgi:MYXO-CTERM domain-containing protein
MHVRSLLVASVVGLAVVSATVARANGRYPLATQLVGAPNDTSYLALRSTFGVLQTFDGGKTWLWVCEQAAGYADIQDPSIALTGDASLLVGFEKLMRTSDRGCTWSAPDGLTASSITDLAVDPGQTGRVVALNATSDGAGGYTNRIFESTDNGRTWAPLGTPITDGLIAETIDLAPPTRIYVSGKHWPTQTAALERSDDGGATWVRQTIDAAGGAVPFIAAIDGASADRVYVRTSDSSSDGVFVTSDAGATWTRIFTASGGILGFALSPDGQSVAVGGPSAGVNVADVSDYQFKQTSLVGPYCLRWSSAGLFACGKQGGDGFALGISTDRGASFAQVLELSAVAPLACPPTSTTGSTCGPYWAPVATVLGADAGPDANMGPTDPGLNGLGGDTPSPSGCHCRAARSSDAPGAPWLAALAALALYRRRRHGGDG